MNEVEQVRHARISIAGGSGGGSNRLSNEPREESVETKWEHLQYYEARLQVRDCKHCYRGLFSANNQCQTSRGRRGSNQLLDGRKLFTKNNPLV